MQPVMMVRALLHSGWCLGVATLRRSHLSWEAENHGESSEEVNGQGPSTLGTQGESQRLRWGVMTLSREVVNGAQHMALLS